MKDPLGKGCKKKGEENCLKIPIFIVSESDVLFEGSFRICWGHGRKGDVICTIWTVKFVLNLVFYRPLFSYNRQKQNIIKT